MRRGTDAKGNAEPTSGRRRANTSATSGPPRGCLYVAPEGQDSLRADTRSLPAERLRELDRRRLWRSAPAQPTRREPLQGFRDGTNPSGWCRKDPQMKPDGQDDRNQDRSPPEMRIEEARCFSPDSETALGDVRMETLGLPSLVVSDDVRDGRITLSAAGSEPGYLPNYEFEPQARHCPTARPCAAFPR